MTDQPMDMDALESAPPETPDYDDLTDLADPVELTGEEFAALLEQAPEADWTEGDL